jgi:hypothetical protein
MEIKDEESSIQYISGVMDIPVGRVFIIER